MKRTIFAGLLLAAALPLFAQSAGGRQQFDLYGGVTYPKNSPLKFSDDGKALKVSGTTSGVAGGAAGYVIESKENLEFSGKNRLIIKVAGVKDTDQFNGLKLLKLELGDKTQTTTTAGMKNRDDPAYINARNGEAEYDISRLRNIRKINLVFFNCTVGDVKIEVFYE